VGKPATDPIARAQHLARQRVERAQTRLPERPVPRVPVLNRYTPAQKRTAAKLVKRSRVQAAGGRGRSAASMESLDRDLIQDPRSRQKLLGARLATALTPRQRAVIYAQARRDTVKPGPQHRHRVGFGPATITVNPHAAIQAALTSSTSGRRCRRWRRRAEGVRDAREAGHRGSEDAGGVAVHRRLRARRGLVDAIRGQGQGSARAAGVRGREGDHGVGAGGPGDGASGAGGEAVR
jgi:hypothetical protein